MEIDVGHYSLECDIDPTVQNNAEGELIPIDSIGFIYNCVFTVSYTHLTLPTTPYV